MIVCVLCCDQLAGRVLSNDGQKLMDAGITDEAVLEMELKSESRTSAGATSSKDDDETLNETDKQAIINTFHVAGRPVDAVFSFDTTGSMYSCLDKVCTRAERFAGRD